MKFMLLIDQWMPAAPQSQEEWARLGGRAEAGLRRLQGDQRDPGVTGLRLDGAERRRPAGEGRQGGYHRRPFRRANEAPAGYPIFETDDRGRRRFGRAHPGRRIGAIEVRRRGLMAR